MKEETFENLNNFIKRWIYCFDTPSAFWAEISYLNNMDGNEWEKRDYLLMIVFAVIKKHYGFAIEITRKASKLFHDQLFNDVEKEIWRLMKLKGYMKLPIYIMKRIAEKLGA